MKKTLRGVLGSPLWIAAVLNLGATGFLEAASASSYGFGKVQSYQQSDASEVILADRNPYSFRAFATPSDASPVLVAALETPLTEEPLLLQPLGGQFSVSRGFGSQAELDAAFPPGTYTMVLVSGMPVFEGPAEFDFGQADFPVPPRLANFGAAQAIDPASEFTLSWSAFEGATNSDYVKFALLDSSGATVFQTGLPGEANALEAGARSVTIPADMLKPGIHTATLTFVRVVAEDDTSYSGAVGRATYAAETIFPVRAGSDAERPLIRNLVRQQDGVVRFEVTSKPGVTVMVEATAGLKEWVSIMTGPSQEGSIMVMDPAAATLPWRFYRASSF
jgi:hypothetical protein